MKLVHPLGAMIIALRQGDSSMTTGFFAEFNEAADEILPLIERDMSARASLMHSAIVSIRREPRNLKQLEQIRERLLLEIT